MAGFNGLGLFPVEIDVYKKHKVSTINAHEDDANGRGLLVTLLKDGVPFNTTGIDLKLAFRNAIGEERLFAFSAVDLATGKYSVTYPREMLEGNGGRVVRVEIKAYDTATQAMISYSPLNVYVSEAVVTEGQLVTNSQGSEFVQLLERVETVETGLGDLDPVHIANVVTLSENAVLAEAGRVSAESGRVSAETARATAESSRQTAEGARQTAESNRASAESTRVSSETSRGLAETARATAEGLRASAEASRTTTETSRVNAESARVTTESSRVNAESARNSNESQRILAEDERVDNEGSRISAESARVLSETARGTAETGRVNAESERVTAEGERTTAETGRANAESSRVTAEQGRVTAEQGRVDAENSRLAALNAKADKTYVDAQLNDKVQNFKLKNEIVNGGFDSGDASWIKTGVNLTIVSGIAEMLSQVPTGFIRQLLTTVVGNKYYFAGKIKSTSTLVKITFGNNDVFVKDLVNYNALSGIRTATSTSHALSIYDTRSSGWDKVYIDKIIVVNLTSIFGAGNEPTKLEMDELMKVIPNNWWDGEITLTQKQVLTLQLNLIRKNTNAIIALGGTII